MNRTTAKALHAYDMISDGDRILVGISGGNDSLSLMSILDERRPRVPVKHRLFPVHVDLGFGGDLSARLKDYFRQQGLSLRVETSDYGPLAHSDANRENPCFLCSMLRRKRIFQVADELKCNKVALGHNKDDIIETFFLNMLYSGQMGAMSPRQSFFENRFTIIRPLAFTEKKTIRRFSGQMKFPDFINPCPSASKTKREDVKKMLENLYETNPAVKGNIFAALRRPVNGPLL